MHTPPTIACPTTACMDRLSALPQESRAEVVYRGLTLAAMLLLLASLWLF